LESLEDGLAGIISGTESVGDAFGKMAQRILADLARIAIEKSILSLIGSAAGVGGAGGGIGGVVGGLFGGARAAGGPVSSGKTYLVGERGPELLRMNGAGTVVPNDRLASAMKSNVGIGGRTAVAPRASSVIVVQPIKADFRGARTDEQTMREFMRYADARSTQARDEAIKVAGKQAPGILAQFDRLNG
jgi:hypothetical protein